ncbi:MAG: Fic family protein [Rhodocyclaceae bacterium]|nr:Fic family protein [Rhodocyclaceae bacterium]
MHPFWDGNGRVGRVIEATLLQAAGYRYAPFAMARHYLDHIHEYFTLFNTCRKNAEKHDASPNQPFVRFHLEGMRVVIHRLHERCNRIVGVLLYESHIRRAFDRRKSTRASTSSFRNCSTRAPPISKRCGTARGIRASISSSTTKPGCAT